MGNSEYLEAPEAFEGLAAAEVVAALGGAGCVGIPRAIADWLRPRPAKQDNLGYVVLALKAIHRIKLASEVKDLHDEAGSSLEWSRVIDDLEARLNRVRNSAG